MPSARPAEPAAAISGIQDSFGFAGPAGRGTVPDSMVICNIASATRTKKRVPPSEEHQYRLTRVSANEVVIW